MQDIPDIHQVIKKLESKLPICRVCLNYSMEYIEFDSTLCLVNDATITYYDAFQLVTPSQVELYDRLPKTLCSYCGNDLLNAFLFRKRVENADIILNKLSCGQNASVKAETEHDEVQSLSSLHNPTLIRQNYLQVDIFLEDPVVEAHTEFTEIEKSGSSSPKSSVFVDTDSESTMKESNGLNKSDNLSVYVRNDCGEVCSTRKNLHDHHKSYQISHYDNSKYEKSFESIDRDQHHSLPDSCELNSVDFKKSALGVVDHINDNELYSCKHCNKKFHSKHLLILHKFRYHKKENTKTGYMREPKIEKKDRCSVCFKMIRKSFMEVHKEVHFGPHNSMCTECGKQFDSRLALRTHSLIHKQSGEFLCHICNKMCVTKYALKSHIQFKHIVDKTTIGKRKYKYQCEDCGLIFQYPSKLRVHQRKHNAETPYICPHCSRSYLRKDQFNIHMRYHTNDLPYKCGQCDKSYATKNNLSEHRKSVHENITYSCDRCEQKFKSVTGLRKHKFVHTGYPYVCPICGLGQSFRSGIKAHLLRVHKDTFTEEEFNETFPVVTPKSGFRRPKN